MNAITAISHCLADTIQNLECKYRSAWKQRLDYSTGQIFTEHARAHIYQVKTIGNQSVSLHFKQ